MSELVVLWRQLLEAVGRASPFTRSYLVEAHPVSLTKTLLTIGFDPEFAEKIDLVDNAKTHGILQTKLRELGCPGVQVKFVKAEAPPDWANVKTAAQSQSASPAPATPIASGRPAANSSAVGEARREKAAQAALSAEEFKNDPLIQKALEIFKGQIVEVRA